MFCLFILCLLLIEDCGVYEEVVSSSAFASFFKLFCLQSSAVLTSRAAN